MAYHPTNKDGRYTQPSTAQIVFPIPNNYSVKDWGGWMYAKGRQHVGQDYGVERGTPVLAMIDGVITNTKQSSSRAGNYLSLEGNFPGKGMVAIDHLHLNGFATGLQPGMRVKAGQIIGYVGNTGATDTAPHLHIHFRKPGAPMNTGATHNFFRPEEFLNATNAKLSLSVAQQITAGISKAINQIPVPALNSGVSRDALLHDKLPAQNGHQAPTQGHTATCATCGPIQNQALRNLSSMISQFPQSSGMPIPIIAGSVLDRQVQSYPVIPAAKPLEALAKTVFGGNTQTVPAPLRWVFRH